MSVLLLGSGADCNIQNESGNTPLHYSALNYKTTKITELLIAFGANFRIPNLYNVTPKDLIFQYGSTEHESLLIGMQDNDPYL
ncbi:ankyrin repeat domain-containing protein [Rickettsia sp. TH2014]|uniref:ankyrin repeat domain-containing protein n=1 Tax=Rickettsia sp. TH2014 TaxID=1967503 RepID=UPI00353225AD